MIGSCGKSLLDGDPSQFEKRYFFFCLSGRSLPSEDLSQLSMDMVRIYYTVHDRSDQITCFR